MSQHSNAMHWATMGEVTFVFGIKLLYAIYSCFGRWPFRLCMYPVILFYWLSNPNLRACSMMYLQRLQAATCVLGKKPNWRHGIRHISLFGETILDKLLAFSGKYKFEHINNVGGDRIYQAALSGQGGIIMTAHMGCLELCQMLSKRRHGFRLNILVHTKHAEQFNRLLKRLNPQLELNLIEVTDITPSTAILLEQKVAAGEFVAIAGDRIPIVSGQTVEVEFLGHPAHFPVGPYVLANLLKCPLYMLCCIHEGAGYSLYFESLAERVVLPRRGREEMMTQLAQQYADRISNLLQRSPYDWFNFFNFWEQARV